LAEDLDGDLSQLRREIEVLDRKIDNAETAVLDAPQNSRSGMYRGLEEMNAERDRLKAELAALACRKAAPERKHGSEIDQAIEALRTRAAAFWDADPADTKQLISTVVSSIVLHFDHGETKAGRKTSKFAYGEIKVRPDLGSGWSFGSGSGSGSSHLNSTGHSVLRSISVFVQGTCTPQVHAHVGRTMQASGGKVGCQWLRLPVPAA
jgi:hypothetical protein